jgi:hypothetical protein
MCNCSSLSQVTSKLVLLLYAVKSQNSMFDVWNCPSVHQMSEEWLLIWSTDFWLWKVFSILIVSLRLRSIPLLKISYYKFDHCKHNGLVCGGNFPEISFPITVHYLRLLLFLSVLVLQPSKWTILLNRIHLLHCDLCSL